MWVLNDALVDAGVLREDFVELENRLSCHLVVRRLNVRVVHERFIVEEPAEGLPQGGRFQEELQVERLTVRHFHLCVQTLEQHWRISGSDELHLVQAVFPLDCFDSPLLPHCVRRLNLLHRRRFEQWFSRHGL